MITKAFVIVSFCVAASLQLTEFTPCENNEPMPENLNVVNCDIEPCLFYKGFNVNAYWDFTAVNYTTSLRPEAKLTAFGFITLPYSIPETNSISTLAYNEKFPLQALDTRTYQLSMPVIDAAVPNVEFVVKLSLFDNNRNVLSCFKVRAKVLIP
ncbi:uncharacterized protein LOC103574879 [Microplitis demolitor]|uniref:uncharacterized protein LOC103574879 n=1 Tax=Microplitis demolitor TaxID=69319 RepID=UPI00043FFD83|nr:uncharacterized protein LOC103574879 [Microplitis demolitor]